MIPYPKHYLADVPHDLRMRVLDLCIHRQWHDGLELLNQNGFTQYEWYELVWFHDHAPSNLPRSADSLSAVDSVPASAEPPSIPDSEISNVECEIRPLALTPEPNLNISPGSLTVGRTVPAEPNLNAASESLTPLCELRDSVVKPSQPRSKIARLPTNIQTNLNTMLARGCPYIDIIRYLNVQGHPGFNKVNLHDWKKTGFQHWLRTEDGKPFSEADHAVLETGSN
jgi:hypothetical protein